MHFDIDIAKRVTAQGRPFDLAVRFALDSDRVALYGPSGAGKSLTLAVLAGLVRPDRGRIAIDGDVWFDSAQGIDRPTRDRHVGFVFQDYALFPHRTVEQNVAAAGERWYPRGPRAGAKEEVQQLLRAFALDDVRASYPEQLSGGQRQRTALARALAAKPGLLLLDEPFSALDAALRTRLRDELVAVQKRFGVPIVIITHDPDDLAQCAERVVSLQDGKVVGGDGDAMRYDAGPYAPSPAHGFRFHPRPAAGT
jgi:molybdate transport system ATP-binding protein